MRPGRTVGVLRRVVGSVRSLQARIVLSTVLLLILVNVLVGVGAAWSLHTYLLRQLDEQVTAVAHFRARPPIPVDDRALPPPDAGGGFTGGPDRPFGTLEVRTAGGRILSAVRLGPAGAERPVPFDRVAPVVAVTPDGPPTTVDLGDLGDYRTAAETTPEGTVFVGIDTAGLEATVTRLVVAEAIVFALATGLAGVISAFTTRNTLRPLHRVSTTARRVAELPLERGEVDLAERVADVDADPRSEVGQVGAAFNRMLGHVAAALEARQESETRLRRFVADASHELRTPLAAIRGYSELARRRSGEMPEEVADMLDRVGSQTERMTVLVEDLLLLARLDAGRPLAREHVDLVRIVVDAVADAHAAAPDHTWSLELPDGDAAGRGSPSAPGAGDPDNQVGVLGDPDRLHRVVTNLLANARTHTPAGTRVTVRLHRDPDRQGLVRLEVRDDGPGIGAEILPRVFERFARGETGRTRTTGSTGLGLSIVAAVVAEHGGTIDVASAPGDTRFVVTVPAAVATEPGPAHS